MASYSSQDRSSVARFTPLSMQEILYPAQMLAQQHIEAEKEYQAEQDKAALLKTMLVQGVDKEAIDELNKYSGTVSSAIDELSNKGVVSMINKSVKSMLFIYVSSIAIYSRISSFLKI